MIMIRKHLVLLFLVLGMQLSVMAQGPRVPSEMVFADIQLKLTEAARKEIQTHVDALYRSEKYLQIKLDRVNFYFPIIEQIFREENLPEDFKYLVIQESALISDAVSSSNAVGFWQFKKSSGEEVGLRIDNAVDERINIVSSTRGAARYLKRNNNYFGNWLYALLSYNTGAGGAQQFVDEKNFGAKRMEINKRTHWYIMKFLAHKVAFENLVGDNHPEFVLVPYEKGANKGFRQIANETGVDQALIEEYNKWLKRGNIPDDKVYTVVIPTRHGQAGRVIAMNEPSDEVPTQEKPSHGIRPSFENRFSKGSDKYPIIEGEAPASNKEAVLAKINGRPGIIAGQNDDLLTLAEKGDISISRFLRFNDLEPTDRAIAGQVYYLKAKRNRAAEHYHTVLETETMWSISQKYGIKLRKLLQKNRMKHGEQAKAGRVLWMRFVRPSGVEIEYKETDPHEIEEQAPVEETSFARREPETPTVQNLPPEKTVQDIPEQNVEADIIEEVRQVTIPDHSGDGEFGTEETVRFVSPTEDLNQNEDVSKKAETHVVQKGETLYGIARQYEVQLGDLLYWNELSLGDGIKIGQELRVKPPLSKQAPIEEPEPNIEAAQFITHVVVAGETLYKIARDYNVTIKDVMQWNNKQDFNVSIGEELKIKK